MNKKDIKKSKNNKGADEGARARRKGLRQKLKKESQLTRKNSMEILSEMEKLEVNEEQALAKEELSKDLKQWPTY